MEIVTMNAESFRPYMGEFAELYTTSFGVQMDQKEVAWRYLENPWGDLLACFALDKGRLVANYSASPIRLIVNGEIIKAGLSLNTMTHPDYFGKGLFVELASRVYRHMYETGYQMILGFPNNISHRTFIKSLGWKNIAVFPTLELSLDKVKKKEHGYVGALHRDDSFAFDYSLRNTNVAEASVYKPREYLSWRYEQHPQFKYYNFAICNGNKVTSHMVLKLFRDRVNLVESMFCSVDEMRCLVNKAIDFGIENEKRLLTAWLPLDSWMHMIYEEYGAVLASPVTYFGANVFGDEADKQFFYNQSSWALSLSDDNVY